MSEVRRIVASGISPLYEMGVRDERERIVSLLMEQTNHQVTIIEVLTLIKRENNGQKL
jgi:hypothetical protein